MVKKDSFRIGDIVVINDFGCVYPNFEEMFRKFKFQNSKVNIEKHPNFHKKYRIIGKVLHPWSNTLMLALRSNSSELIVDAKACSIVLKLQTNKNIKVL